MASPKSTRFDSSSLSSTQLSITSGHEPQSPTLFSNTTHEEHSNRDVGLDSPPMGFPEMIASSDDMSVDEGEGSQSNTILDGLTDDIAITVEGQSNQKGSTSGSTTPDAPHDEAPHLNPSPLQDLQNFQDPGIRRHPSDLILSPSLENIQPSIPQSEPDPPENNHTNPEAASNTTIHLPSASPPTPPNNLPNNPPQAPPPALNLDGTHRRRRRGLRMARHWFRQLDFWSPNSPHNRSASRRALQRAERNAL
ncbi:hypothetical protein MMC25_001230 [Agyrium rufum]|nr:hypothetical protein [Agyrium rufum]